jgi:hypothetical protein
MESDQMLWWMTKMLGIVFVLIALILLAESV